MKNLTGKSSIIMLSQTSLAATEEGDTSTDWKGVRFRKQIASFGDWVDPNDPSKTMTLDDAFADQMIENFDAMRSGAKKQLPRVAVPMNHTDDSYANSGEVVALEKDSEGIWATMEIRDWGTQFKIEDDLVWDVSMAFDFDYEDTKGERHGVVLEHVALVNNPYLFGMAEFERAPEQVEKDAAIRAYWDDMDDWYDEFSRTNSGSAIMLSKSKAKELRAMAKRKKQLEKESKITLAKVTNDREFDVTITVQDEDGADVEQVVKAGETVDVPDDQEEAVKKQIADAEEPTDEDLSDETPEEKEAREKKEAEDAEGDDDKDKKDNTPNPDRDNKTLSKTERAELAKLRAEKADTAAQLAYKELLDGGFITPAQKDDFIRLHKAGSTAKVKLSRDKKEVELSTSDAIVDLVKAGGKRVDFSQNGSGKTETGDDNAAVSKNLSSEQTDGLKANGISAKQVDDLAAKSPLYAEQMAKLTKKDK